MGNEDKVIKRIEQSKKKFLPPEVFGESESSKAYLLEKEFFNTKKNINLGFYLIIIIFLISIATGTIFLTNYLEKDSRKVDLGIIDFEQLALKEILEEAANAEKRLLRQELELAALKKEKKEMLKIIKEKFSNQRKQVSESNFSDIKLKDQLTLINTEELSEKNKTSAEYDRKIAEKEKKILELKELVRKQKNQMEKRVKEVDAVVNNYKKLNQLKLDEQKKKLTGKYNPRFSNRKLLQLVSDPPPLIRTPIEDTVQPILHTKKIIKREDFDKLEKNAKNFRKLSDRLQKIPYINSVPGSLRQMDYLHHNTVKMYKSIWTGLSKNLENKKLVLKGYQYAFDQLINKERENGFIIDPRNPNSVKLHLDPLIPLNNIKSASIFRNDDEFIGSMELVLTKEGVIGKITEIFEGKSPLPFDKILIKTGKNLNQSKQGEKNE